MREWAKLDFQIGSYLLGGEGNQLVWAQEDFRPTFLGRRVKPRGGGKRCQVTALQRAGGFVSRLPDPPPLVHVCIWQ